ncbi:hypothetical protein TWF730_010620 [Orbilia blumenaviensis]|uniref:Uncharacterized protein n=1 Tax=Orbilia blumenaviensis TaxID=1796055 RepID=A0AAV9URB4_9PEZI
MNASVLHVTTRVDLDGSDVGTGSSSSLSSLQTLPSVSDSSLTAPEEIETRVFEDEYDRAKDRYGRGEEFEERSGSSQKYRNVPKYENKTNLSIYDHRIFQRQKHLSQDHQLLVPSQDFNGSQTSTGMATGYDVYGPTAVVSSSSSAQTGTPYNQNMHAHYRTHDGQQHYPGPENTGHPNDYFNYIPGETVNIKERRFPLSNLKTPKSSTRVKAARQVRFILETVDEDAPIPCNPVDCPESRLTLENARLAHALPSGPSSYRGPGTSSHHSYQQYPPSLPQPPPPPPPLNQTHNGPGHQTSPSILYPRNHPIRLSPRSSSTGVSNESRGSCLEHTHTSAPRGLETPRSSTASTPRFAYRAPARPNPDVAEVEGDNTFPGYEGHDDLASSVSNLGLIPLSPSFYPPSPQNNEDRPPQERDAGPDAPEITPELTSKKPKEIFKKLLGSRPYRHIETRLLPFTEKFESNYSIRSVNLESKKEWAFVAISPDSKTIVGVCDREYFVSYSIEASGVKALVYGEFDGEPSSIAVSDNHLAISTLTKLQVFNHHNGKRIYECASSKSVTTDNFTSIVFANSGVELCAALTNGTMQFHYIAAITEGEAIFRRGDPRMDIGLNSGDYAFTMSFSADDIRFACGTQKRMLMVYEHRGSSAWELTNKFKFPDWEPGTHRRISGAIFFPEERFIFATTTSARASAYMYCIDSNKHTNCPHSASYAPPITKKGVTRSAMSPDGRAIALIDGDGTVYKCEFDAGSVFSDKQEFTKLPGTLIPARACWISWTSSGDLILLDKKGHLRIYDLAPVRTSFR